MKEAWKNGSSARWLKFADLWIFKKWLLFIQLHGILTTASKVRRAGGECVRHSLQKQYLIVLALETSFVEENFSTVGTGYSLGMIQVHYMYHALYF